MKAENSIRNMANIIRLDGEKGCVFGEYRVVARPTRGNAPSPEDYAVIVLEDGTEVFLETFATPQAQRELAERQRFDGCSVRVEGTIHRWMPNIGQGPLVPSLSDITDIKRVNCTNSEA